MAEAESGAEVDAEGGSGFDRSPGLVSIQASVAAAVLGVVVVFPGGVFPFVLAALGAAALAVGAVRGSRRAITGGATLLFLGAMFSTLWMADPFFPLLAGALAVVAWDVAEHGIGVGEQLGREAATTRLEVAHASASAIVGLLAVAVGYGLYTVAWSGLPTAALVLFLSAALLLTWGLRE